MVLVEEDLTLGVTGLGIRGSDTRVLGHTGFVFLVGVFLLTSFISRMSPQWVRVSPEVDENPPVQVCMSETYYGCSYLTIDVFLVIKFLFLYFYNFIIFTYGEKYFYFNFLINLGYLKQKTFYNVL